MSAILSVTNSETIKGAGLLAGGPYGSSYFKYAHLKDVSFSDEEVVNNCTSKAEDRLANGLIDDLANLKDMPIYIQANTNDSVNKP